MCPRIATWRSSMHLNLNVQNNFWSLKNGQPTHPTFPVLTNDTTIPSVVQVPNLMVSVIPLYCLFASNSSTEWLVVRDKIKLSFLPLCSYPLWSGCTISPLKRCWSPLALYLTLALCIIRFLQSSEMILTETTVFMSLVPWKLLTRFTNPQLLSLAWIDHSLHLVPLSWKQASSFLVSGSLYWPFPLTKMLFLLPFPSLAPSS